MQPRPAWRQLSTHCPPGPRCNRTKPAAVLQCSFVFLFFSNPKRVLEAKRTGAQLWDTSIINMSAHSKVRQNECHAWSITHLEEAIASTALFRASRYLGCKVLLSDSCSAQGLRPFRPFQGSMKIKVSPNFREPSITRQKIIRTSANLSGFCLLL